MKNITIILLLLIACCLSFLVNNCQATFFDHKDMQEKRFVYWLQGYDYENDQNKAISSIAKGSADMVVLDLYKDEDSQIWTKEETDRMRANNPNKKIVYYVSLGEAENYRPYWEKEWDTNRPDWMGQANPDYPDNYKVKYWASEWKSLVKKYIDNVIETNADGMFFDVVDAYEYWEENGTQQEQENAQLEMKKVITEMVAYARAKSNNPDFDVIVNNGPDLLKDPAYKKVITGIVYEDLWFNGNSPQSQEAIDYVMNLLDLLKKEGKQVTIINYSTQQNKIALARQKALEAGYSFVNLPRDLNTYPDEKEQLWELEGVDTKPNKSLKTHTHQMKRKKQNNKTYSDM